MALKVNEIFHSIQGESTYVGRACVFVRLAGCNPRCTYCDTTYAYEAGEELEIGSIIDRVASYQCHLVSVTGGEPLIQEKTPALIRRLLEQGHEVLLETNGTQDISRVDERCVKIVDVKCPTSGEADKNDLINLCRLQDHCYDPSVHGKACGQCDSCLLRKRGCREAEVADPTVYAEKKGHPLSRR